MRRRIAPFLTALAASALLVVLPSCRTAPEEVLLPEPPPPPATAPAPTPPPEPPPPPPQAPLEGPRWILQNQYGTSRMPHPPEGTLWVQFDSREGLVRGSSGGSALQGAYQKTPSSGLAITPGRPPSPPERFARYYTQTLENLSLVKGYYIQGDTYYESTLTLYGGVGREEIILAEFLVDPESPLVLPSGEPDSGKPPR